MRTAKYTALAATLITAATVPALADGAGGRHVIGSFTIGGGAFIHESTDDPDVAGTNLVLIGSGSIAFQLEQDLLLQADIFGEQVTGGEDVDQYFGMQGIGGHLVQRVSSNVLLGVFAGYGGATVSDDGDPWSGGWFGLEGQYWCDDVTVVGQVALLDISDHNGGNDEGLQEGAYLARAIGRYFFTNDVKAEVEIAYLEADEVLDDADDGEVLEWGLSLQGRIAEEPLYGTLSFRSGYYDATTENDDADVQTFTISLTYLFGVKNLQEDDRTGTSFDTPTTHLRSAGMFSELD